MLQYDSSFDRAEWVTRFVPAYDQSAANLNGFVSDYSYFSQLVDPYNLEPNFKDITIDANGDIWFTINNEGFVGKFSSLTGGAYDGYDPIDQPPISNVSYGLADVALSSGNAQIAQPLDLHVSIPEFGPPWIGEPTALVYNSAFIEDLPVVVGTFDTDPEGTIPTKIEARINFAQNGWEDWLEFSTSGYNPGDTITLAVPIQADFQLTKNHEWTMEIRATYGTLTMTRDISGDEWIISGAFPEFGKGWGIGGLDKLAVLENEDVYWLYIETGIRNW